ncbi:hypothetical protein AB0F91_18270 [Amycolatopsis sp. NPDC023774]|uniref:hypothetical protein n=1 Tax=Amycolatopsis sp. NPDC023774 TaxID=3155015 RepID=UPI0033ECED4D
MSDKTDTVRVWEPDPKMPAAQLRVRKIHKAQGIALLGVLLIGGGIALFFAHVGPAAPLLLIYLGLVIAVQWGRGAVAALSWALKWRWHTDLALEQVAIPADGLIARRKTVAVRLPDGRWLRARPGAGVQAQLAGQRSLWLARSGDQALAIVAGSPSAWLARIHDEPPSGARELPVLSREQVAPRHDPVLNADRDARVRGTWLTVAVSLGACALAVWAGLEILANRSDGGTAAFVQVLILAPVAGGAIIAFLHALGSGIDALGLAKAHRADTWTELAVSRSKAQLPDGRTVHIRLPKRPGSLALNVTASHTLWTFGPAKPGKVRVGVPGYPVAGQAWLTLGETRAGAQ